ncbi:hypothetical protein LG047_15595 [Methylocystis sp. WRRC1]|uniref:hypothetical protein n=1 Tax=Methylocystis sp. WRRC1 TaxID=1732014 RepID=UPI001D1561B0|nr:hypothetical protein [Methylocystis sp. WRRC1]MCC3246724.1 hypothetical protein [Methylocystis sp. WRRC1]
MSIYSKLIAAMNEPRVVEALRSRMVVVTYRLDTSGTFEKLNMARDVLAEAEAVFRRTMTVAFVFSSLQAIEVWGKLLASLP